ncbi:MAG TPA: PAS domain-containing protein [Holophagaceae bacterium]|nr:PAS domain-containing protein [Holophagaceae bacterium]
MRLPAKAPMDRELRIKGLPLMVDAIQDYAIFLLDANGHVATWNLGAQRSKGYRPDEIIGRHFRCFYPPEEIEAGQPEEALARAAAEGRYEMEGWRIRKDGSRFFANVIISALHEEGNLLGFVKVTRDITEKRALIESLQRHQHELETLVAERSGELEQERRTLQLIYDAHQDPMMLLKVEPGPDYRVVSLNQACGEALGQRPAEIVGKLLEPYLRPPAEPELATYRRAVETGEAQHLERRAPLGGRERIFDSEVIPLPGPDGAPGHLLVSARDITERVRMEESLRQTQRLESLGVLAGGIAHDFNNLLTTVLGNASLGGLALPPESPGRPYLDRIEEATVRAADLTRQLLAYAGKGNFVKITVDLNRAVQEMTQLLSVSISKKAALRFDLSEIKPKVEADPSQIQQLIMNLVTNASEAIGEETSGLITVRTGLQHLDEHYIQNLALAFPVEPGLYATLEVSDTGCGMSAETQAKIFDPFFTTKFTGRGLGLSAMMGILRTHHGSLKLYSEVGRGTTFKLFLPAVGATWEDPEAQTDPGLWRTHGRILVVDDEVGARTVTRQMAEHIGLEVVEACDGREAVELFKAHQGQLRLVIMDLTMPHMDGREAFRRFREVDATVPVILCSGYNEADAAQDFVGHGLAGFLQKPFRHKAFAAAVRAVLEGL